MSEKDRRIVTDTPAVALPNGVDLDRFRPAAQRRTPRRILFIGSFAHRPNVMAVEFFLAKCGRCSQDATLHIIAGARHEQYAVDADLDRGPASSSKASSPTSAPPTGAPQWWLPRWWLPPAPTSRCWRRWRWARPWSARPRESTASI